MMEGAPPPAGYREVGDLFADFETAPGWLWLVWGSLMALIPLVGVAVAIWLPYRFYAALGAPLAVVDEPGWGQGVGVGVLVALLVLTIPAHECLHALVLIAQGHPARLRWARGYFFATTSHYLSRSEYMIMSLTPFVALNVGGAALLVLLPVAVGDPLVYALLLNAAASVGDLVVAARVRRQPKEALFADRDGIKVFEREKLGEDGEV